jgi:20S proteasome subunit beta 7
MEYQFPEPITKTLTPIVTGSNLVAIKYKDGVIACTDMLASYGSMCKFKEFSKCTQLNQYSAIVTRGDLSDYQEEIKLLLKESVMDLQFEENTRSPKEFAKFLSRYHYHYRMKMDPWLTNSMIIGYKDSPYLGIILI